MSVSARTLHSKRSFGKHPKIVDSPAYDASEEDNDPMTDDGRPGHLLRAGGGAAGTMGTPGNRKGPATANAAAASSTGRPSGRGQPSQLLQHHLAHHLVLSDSDGIDSPTYDGDIESSAAAGGGDRDALRDPRERDLNGRMLMHHSSVSTLNGPLSPTFSPGDVFSPETETPGVETSNPLERLREPSSGSPSPVPPSSSSSASGVIRTAPLLVTEEPEPAAVVKEMFNPASLTQEDIQSFVAKAIEGEPGRSYKINRPPEDRAIRVYADGVYDLFHFGHALQLRQAKLSFPNVYLLVGVCSDEMVYMHKNRTIMNHAERLEGVRHCRWVDQVVDEAPWIIDQAFLEKYQIDYVAHDEDAYAGGGHDDVYGFCKNQGKFIPTRRTPGVSTSELLERIVFGYRNLLFDAKLEKMGHAELKAEGSDYDDASRRASRRPSRAASPSFGVTGLSPESAGNGR